jgi:hypothetical protein
MIMADPGGRVIHPDSELRFVNATIGYGLFATRLIPHGTVTWVRDDLDQIVDPAAHEGLAPMLAALLHKYSYLEPRGRVLCWDHGRFVNHSCDPNCRSTGFDFEIAVRDIQPGEEITDDYGSLNVDYEFDCRCGSPRCRGTIRARDITRFADDWDRDAAAAFARAGSLAQPLWPLLKEQADVERALRGEIPLPSCRAHALPELL